MTGSSVKRRLSEEEEKPAVKRPAVKGVDIADDDDDETVLGAKQSALNSWTGDVETEGQDRSRTCPYLDTINRTLLDFDFEKVCSVSLSNQNVYACLVCGKYFQGRGQRTHAHTHAVTSNHHVFINLRTKKFYCLPDNYEVIDASLKDITDNLDPLFTDADIVVLDTNNKPLRALDGATYYQGVIGMNNIKRNDYVNVVLQALARISDLRDFFLKPQSYSNCHDPLVVRTGELIRKLWSPHHYRSHVSPHELLQAIVDTSEKKFQITEQSFAVEFLTWYLNALHTRLLAAMYPGGGKKAKNGRTIITQCFQGRMRMTERRMRAAELMNDEVERERALIAERNHESFETTTREMPFLYLTLDVPPAPLFQDAEGASIIPQVPLFTLLNKFDGETEQRRGGNAYTYKLLSLPKYLILYIKRFTKNNFFLEKNPTIVNFPVKNLELRDYVEGGAESMQSTKYDLVANIVRDGTPESGKYRVHLLHKGTGNWHEMEDLIQTDVLPQVITLSASYLMIYERQQ